VADMRTCVDVVNRRRDVELAHNLFFNHKGTEYTEEFTVFLQVLCG
jgi:hypothetical protein